MAGFSREELYGEKAEQKRDESGNVLQSAYLSDDGLHIFVSGGLTMIHLDEDGNLATAMKTVDEEGKEIPLVPNMFCAPNQLKLITLDQLSTLDTFKTYILEGDDIGPLVEFVKKSNAEGKFPAFTYAYFNTPNPQDAVLVASVDKVIILLGKLVEPQFFGPQKIVEPEQEAPAEQESEQEVEFDTW